MEYWKNNQGKSITPNNKNRLIYTIMYLNDEHMAMI